MYDILILLNSVYAGIECKVVHAIESFPFARVRDHQIKALQDVHNNNGRGLILVNIRIPRHQEVKVITVNNFVHLQTTLPRKSIPADLFESLPGVKKKGALWDIKQILNLPYP